VVVSAVAGAPGVGKNCVGLADDVFSYRDRGLSLSLIALALVHADEPEAACISGWEALVVAGPTDSKRTKRELIRLCGLLEPWQAHRPAVRELAETVRTTCS
jgi:hypothetical protein